MTRRSTFQLSGTSRRPPPNRVRIVSVAPAGSSRTPRRSTSPPPNQVSRLPPLNAVAWLSNSSGSRMAVSATSLLSSVPTDGRPLFRDGGAGEQRAHRHDQSTEGPPDESSHPGTLHRHPVPAWPPRHGCHNARHVHRVPGPCRTERRGRRVELGAGRRPGHPLGVCAGARSPRHRHPQGALRPVHRRSRGPVIGRVDLPDGGPRHGADPGAGREGDAGRHRQGGPRRSAGRQPLVGQPAGPRARQVPVPDRPDHAGTLARVRRPRIDGLGQADQGEPGRRRPARGGALLVLRRLGGQARVRVPRPDGASARRSRPDHPVELPAAHAGLEDRAGPRRRQHGRPQAGLHDAADRAALRRRLSPGGPAAGRRQHRPRTRRRRDVARDPSRASTRSRSPAPRTSAGSSPRAWPGPTRG